MKEEWECVCGAMAPAHTPGWSYTDAAWCPEHAWLR
jgi:hypothetical protein